jgi:hypothetical protein
MHLFGVVLSFFLMAGGVAAQTSLVGRAIDASSRLGIAGVRISAHDEGGREKAVVFSDTTGRFHIALEPGEFLLRTSRVGYVAAETRKLELNEKEQIELLIQMDVRPIGVEPLVIVGKRTMIGRLMPYYQRLDRAEVSGGRFITRAQIDSLGIGDITEHIQQHGVPVQSNRGGERWPLGYGGCRMRVFIDDAPAEGFAIDALVRAENVEGVEIYRSGLQAPPLYSSRSNTCGVVLIWTRADRAGTLSFWKGLMVGAGVITSAVLIRLLWRR